MQAARAIQERRFAGTTLTCNAEIGQAPRTLAVLNGFLLAVFDWLEVANVASQMRLFAARDLFWLFAFSWLPWRKLNCPVYTLLTLAENIEDKYNKNPVNDPANRSFFQKVMEMAEKIYLLNSAQKMCDCCKRA